MKVTLKGQVTIPQHLREKAGIMPGSEVEFTEAKDGSLNLRKINGKGRGRQIVEALRGLGTVRMSTDEIMALTRGKR